MTAALKASDISEGGDANAASREPTTREAILSRALELFATQGYAGTSMRSLARAVGLRESSIYNHFASKDHILKALVEMLGPARSASRLSSLRYQAMAASPTAFCRMHAADVFEQWCDPLEQRLQELLYVERQRLAPERELFTKAWFHGELKHMTGFFEGFLEQRLIDVPDAAEGARSFMSGLTFIRLEHFLMPTVPTDPAKVFPLVEHYVETFLKLIRASDGGPKPRGV